MRMRLLPLSIRLQSHGAPSPHSNRAALVTWLSVAAAISALSLVALFAISILQILVPPITTVGDAIVEVIAATIFLYVASKVPALLTLRTVGYSEAARAPENKHLSEPALLGISLVLAAIVVTYFGWWHHRLAAREYAHSKGCYAELETADRVPTLDAKFAPGELGYHAALYLSNAELHGGMLGMRREAIDADLPRAAAAYFKSYSKPPIAAAERRDSALLDDVLRCVNDDWAPHVEILNP